VPIHDWTRVGAGIFHHFLHGWIEEIARVLNRGLLPPDYYALAEQRAAGLEPDVLTLQGGHNGDQKDAGSTQGPGGGVLLAAPKLRPIAETDMSYYRRRASRVAVRHASGDDLVAVVEVLSPGNKAGINPLRSFVEKAAELLERHIHLLILDLFPPGRRDPHGIHAAIWEEIAGEEFAGEGYAVPKDRPLTLAAYESGLSIRAYVVHAAVGEALSDMPLFLEPEKAVEVPLEATYKAAFAAVPGRWRRVLEATP
jgi:hypothetical protein